MSKWKKQRRQFDEMIKRKKSLERLQGLFLTPAVEDLEQRIAPATMQYSAPLGLDFVAKLKSTGTDIELVDESNSVLASMPIEEVTDVRITGSNHLSTLTIDESSPIDFPIIFDTADAADKSLYTLNLQGDTIGAATYEPTYQAGHLGVLNYGVNPVYFGSHVALLAEKLGSFTYVTPTGSNHVTLDSPNAGQTVVSDTQGSDTLATVTVANVAELLINQKDHSDPTDVSTVTIASTGLLAAGLGHVKIETGAGSSTVKFENSDVRLPVAGQGVEVVGGDGALTIQGPNETNTWVLAGEGTGTLTNTVSETAGVQGFVQFTNVAVITGGTGADSFTVRSSSNFAGTIDGGEGDDTYDVTLSPQTGNMTVSDTGVDSADTLTVTSLGLTDHLVDSGSAIASDHYATVHHTGVETVTLADVADLDTRIQTILREYQAGARTADVDLHPGSVELGGFVEMSNVTVSFKNISDPLGQSANGTVTFTTENATLFPGNPLMAEIGDGSVANKYGIYGSYELSTKTYGIGVTELKLSSDQIEVTVDNVLFKYNPALSSHQELVHINNVTAVLPGLKDTTVTLAGLSFRGDGFSIDNASVVLPNVKLGSVLEVTSPTVSFTNVSYTAASGSDPQLFTGTLGISAATATLFPGKKFTGTATTVAGNYTFETNTVSVTAAQVDLTASKFFTASATNVEFHYDTQATGRQTLVTIASINLTVQPLHDLNVAVSNLAIRTDGFSIENVTVTPGNLALGSVLTVTNPTVSLTGIDFTQPTDGTAASYTGNLTLAADAAALFPGKKFSGSITPEEEGQPAISGTVNLTSGAISLTAGQVDLTSAKLFTASAKHVVLAYDPSETGSQTIVSIASIDLTIKPLKDTVVNVHNLAIRTDGFSFDNLSATLPDMSFGSFLTIAAPTIAFTDVNLTQSGSGVTFAGSLTVSAGSAGLLPGKKFSGTITPLAEGQPAIKGTVNLASGAFSLTAGQLDLTSEKLFTASATNIVLAYDPAELGTQTLVSIASLDLTIKPLKNTNVTVQNLAIRTDGFSFDDLAVTLPDMSFGTYLTIAAPRVAFSGVNLTVSGSSVAFAGSLSVSAGSASLLPGKKFSGTITPAAEGQAAIKGTVDLVTGAFSLTAGQVDLGYQNFFTGHATNVVVAFDPVAIGPQTIVSIGSMGLKFKPLNDLSIDVANLAIRTDGFSFDNLSVTTSVISIGSVISITSPTIIMSGVNLTMPPEYFLVANLRLRYLLQKRCLLFQGHWISILWLIHLRLGSLI